jgi:hypothetical protein
MFPCSALVTLLLLLLFIYVPFAIRVPAVFIHNGKRVQDLTALSSCILCNSYFNGLTESVCYVERTVVDRFYEPYVTHHATLFHITSF